MGGGGRAPWRWSVARPELGLETVLAHHAGHELMADELRRAVYGSARSWRQKAVEPFSSSVAQELAPPPACPHAASQLRPRP
jgi:hypothetical protein